MRTNKNNKAIKGSEVLIHLKCKDSLAWVEWAGWAEWEDSQEWEVWVDSREWVEWEVMAKMRMTKNKEILTI